MGLHDDRGFDREILDIIPERFDADPDSRYARRGAHTRLILAVALALLALAALGVAARHIFFEGGPKVQAENTGGVPLIKADDKPIKTKPGPEERGGMEVPNRDKLVYERMGSSESEPQSERLLPPPETPQPPPAQPRAPTIKPAFSTPPAKEVVPTPAPARVAAPVPPPPVQVPPPAAATAPAQVAAAAPPPPPAAKASAAKPVAAAPPPPAAPAKAIAGGSWVVQLAALKTESEARAEWTRIHSANKDIVGSLGEDIVRVDLGAKGVYWRVRGGPLAEAQARTICAQLTKRNQGCIIAKR